MQHKRYSRHINPIDGYPKSPKYLKNTLKVFTSQQSLYIALPGSQSVFLFLPLDPGQACHWPLAENSAWNKLWPWPVQAHLPQQPWKQGWWLSHWSLGKPGPPEGDHVHLFSGRKENHKQWWRRGQGIWIKLIITQWDCNLISLSYFSTSTLVVNPS